MTNTSRDFVSVPRATLERARSVIDKFMGDSDLPDDNSDEMTVMQEFAGEDVRNEFEKYPALAVYMERLANTGLAFDMNRWSGFCDALNNALKLSAPPSTVTSRQVLTRSEYMVQTIEQYISGHGGDPHGGQPGDEFTSLRAAVREFRKALREHPAREEIDRRGIIQECINAIIAEGARVRESSNASWRAGMFHAAEMLGEIIGKAPCVTSREQGLEHALRESVAAMKRTWTIIKPFVAGEPTVSADKWIAACDQLDAALTKAKGELNVQIEA